MLTAQCCSFAYLASALLLARVAAACPGDLVVIRNVKSVVQEEKKLIVEGIHKMKTLPSSYDNTTNSYDYFVMAHRFAVTPNTEVHAAWRFFPWLGKAGSRGCAIRSATQVCQR